MFKKMKSKRIFALALAGALSFLGACSDQTAEPAADSSSDEEVIRFGMLAPLTGSAASYGVSTTNGEKMAIDAINQAGGIDGKQIEYTLEDSKDDPTEAVNAYNKLLDAGVVAFIGDITSGTTNAVAQESVDDGIPLITPTGTGDDVTIGRDNVFRTCYTNSFQGTVLANFAVDSLGAKTAAVLYNNSSDYSSGIAQAFINQAEELGLEIIIEESYGDADQDFSAQMTNIAGQKPDVLVIPDYYEKDALILQQAREAGVESAILGGDGWDGVIQQLGDRVEEANGVYFTNHYSINQEDEEVQEFVESYREEFGEDPTAFSALGYDSVFLLKEAIEQAGTTEKEAVVNALKDIDYQGITGKLTFDENNNPVKDVTMIEIKDGEYEFYERVSGTATES